jgi:hypothetical protein
MDCRVKPGNDEKDGPQSLPVTRGLDPWVHRSSQELFAKPMDCRVKPGNDSPVFYGNIF